MSVVAASHGETIAGKVVGVSDGDTVTVLDAAMAQHKIRLARIDAPEKAQSYGQRSKENLSQIVFAKQVAVETNKTDKYGRKVGKILVNGVDANLEQVRAGFAWHYKEYAREQSATDRDAYARAETAARAARVGLWRDANPMAPWDWRHGGKNEAAATREKTSDCSCGGESLCTGSKGGQYCLTANGKRKYQ